MADFATGFAVAFAVRVVAVDFFAPVFAAAVFALAFAAAGFLGLAVSVAFLGELLLCTDVFAFSFALSNSAVERGLDAVFFFVADDFASTFFGEALCCVESSFGV